MFERAAYLKIALVAVLIVACLRDFAQGAQTKPAFFSQITDRASEICREGRSSAGYIGITGDSETHPRRSFFWLFEAERHAREAPLILTVGGGPGTSGMMNAFWGQSSCIASADGPIPNPHKWTEKYNLLALDHPIGVGLSYGSHVNTSRAAAYDVYDFLQKFYVIYPHLADNPLVVSGGSYGGAYVPHIATVIQERNAALKSVGLRHTSGDVHINLQSLMLSNPLSDPIAYFRWTLHFRCVLTDLYNATQCTDQYAVLPQCLENLELAQQDLNTQMLIEAGNLCLSMVYQDNHGKLIQDVRKECNPLPGQGETSCIPEFAWVETLFRKKSVKKLFGVPDFVNFTASSSVVYNEFDQAGDIWQPNYLLYEPLLEAGIRVLHYVGQQDGDTTWPGVLSFLKMLRTRFQTDFNNALDLPWTSENITVRSVGPGAGSMTLILVKESGHFVVKDQPALTKSIVEHWIDNRPYLP